METLLEEPGEKKMFVIPKETAKKVILGEMDYNKLPYNEDNEVAKGWNFEDQARVNLKLEKEHDTICTALEEACKKQSCFFYSNKSGKIPDGWTCREYKVDFPTAGFDSRHHVTLIGNDKIDWDASIDNLEELAQQGAEHVCLGCKYPYQNKPTQPYETGHGFAYPLEMCSCGSDLFDTIKEFMKWIKAKD